MPFVCWHGTSEGYLDNHTNSGRQREETEGLQVCYARGAGFVCLCHTWVKECGVPLTERVQKIISVIEDLDTEAVIEATILRKVLITHLGLIPDKQSKHFSVEKVVNSMVEWAQHALFPDDVEEMKFSYLTFLLLYFRLGCSSKSAEKFMSAWVQQADGEMHQSLQDLHRQRRQKRSSVQSLFAMGMVEMLPGEMVWTETLDVAWSLDDWGSKKTSIQGGLYATNYRLIFVCFPSGV